MTSIHSSSQKFNKLEWIQQKIEEIRKECGTANSGKAGDEQYAEVCRRMVGALGLIATRSGEDLTPDTAGRYCTAWLYHHAPDSQHRVSLPKRASASFARSAGWRSSLPKKMTLIP